MEKNNSVQANEIATKGDLAQQTEQIIASVKQLIKEAITLPAPAKPQKYLRSRDVMEMLGISPNKLKDMRLKKEIPFSINGKTFFYPEEELIEAMNKNLYPAKP